MADFEAVLDSGDFKNGFVNTVVEIPKWSTLKVEWDRTTKTFKLDRVEPSIFAKPCNYGFIPRTTDEDGDALDTLLLTNEPVPTGVWLEARIIGVMNFEDDGEMDHKIIVVPVDDRNVGKGAIASIDDLHDQWKLKIEHHFNHYKDLKKPGTTKVLGWGDIDDAKKIIAACVERYNHQQ